MAHPLDGCRLKLGRAQEHLGVLQEQVRVFLESKPYEVASDYDLEATKEDGRDWTFIWSVVVHRDPPPNWGPIIGDVLHNLRSSLDHLAWALALQHSGKGISRTEFPIFVDSDAYRLRMKDGSLARGSGLFKVRGITPEAQAIIEELQPYNRRENPASHPLWMLQELSNRDKHRTLHVVGSIVVDPNLFIEPHAGGLRVESQAVYSGKVENGTVVARAAFTASEYQSAMGVQEHFPFKVAFDEAGPAMGRELVPTLDDLFVFVRDKVIPRFLNFF